MVVIMRVADQTGGSSYDQSLNTTDDVTFNDVDVDGTLTVDSLTVAGTGAVAFNSGNTLTLEATDRVEVTNQTPFRLSTFTTTQRDAISTPQNGDTIYNTTTNNSQTYANGSWVNATSSDTEQSFDIQTSNFTASSSQRYAVDTSSSTVTMTLPASPNTGDAIFVADAGGNYATNNLTVARNGNTIMGLSQDMTVSTNNQSFGLLYNGNTWRTY